MVESDISVVILTYNRPAVLENNLQQLAPLIDVFREVIVVDNSSDDLSQKMVQNLFPWVHLISNKVNTGIAGRNIGMKMASGEVIVTLDDDVTGLGAEDFHKISQIFSEQPKLGGLCFRILHAQTGDICNWCHHREHEQDSFDFFLTYEISEGAVAYRREALEKSGYYFSKFFLSHEGKDLAFRLMNNGYKVGYFGKISVIHSFAPSGRTNWRRYYFDTRNSIWLAVRNMPFWYAFRFLFVTLILMGVYSIRDGFLKYWIWAIKDGIHEIPEIKRERIPWSPKTKAMISEIDSARPPFWYKLKRRFFRRGVQI